MNNITFLVGGRSQYDGAHQRLCTELVKCDRMHDWPFLIIGLEFQEVCDSK